MKITDCYVDNNALVLVTTRKEAFEFAGQFRAGTDYEIKPVHRKRSLDSNALAWALIDKIAVALQAPKEVIYRNAIRNIGGVSETVCCKREAVEHLVRGWTNRGLGWQTQVEPSKIPGCQNVILYFGSSSYNAGQMSLLINDLQRDAAALGIEAAADKKDNEQN
jgi:hypothetical protein